MGASTEHTARIFERLAQGDASARGELVEAVYVELRSIAAGQMRSQPVSHTLQVTALVNEAYLRLVGADGGGEWNDRSHFLGAAAQAMRTALIDHARARGAQKRGGDCERVPLDSIVAGFEAEGVNLLDLNASLERLRLMDPRSARLVELRTFGGLSEEEAARVLGVSPRSSRRLWKTSRMWLRRDLQS